MGEQDVITSREPLHERVSARQRRLILLTVTLAAFLNPFTASSINLALPILAEEFSLDALMLSWVPGAYLLAFIIFLLPTGRLGDSIGRVRVFKGGTLVYTLASLLILISFNSFFLLICRFLQGVGGAMVFSSVTAIIADFYPPGERGRALGINVMVVYLGLSMGPFLGGLLTEFFGWRSIFIVTLGVAGCTIILFDSLPDYRIEIKSRSFDFPGVSLFALALVCFYIGLTQSSFSTRIFISILSLFLFLGFVVFERRFHAPLFPLALFSSNRTFAYSNVAAVINYGATYAVALLLSLYLQYIRGLAPATAGLVLLLQPMVQMLLSPVAGGLSDRYRPARIAAIGLILSCISLLFFSFIQTDTPQTGIYLSLILLGAGLALFSAPNTNAIMNSVSRENYGVASATVATMRALGMTLSMGIVMLVFGFLIGAVPITLEVYEGMLESIKIIFAACACLSLVGAILLIRLK